MRLIDADALIKDLIEGLIPKQRKNGKIAQAMVANIIKQIIALQPTIDAVPVVRCKDCKYYTSVTAHCETRGKGLYLIRGKEDYCSRAERKSDE